MQSSPTRAEPLYEPGMAQSILMLELHYGRSLSLYTTLPKFILIFQPLSDRLGQIHPAMTEIKDASAIDRGRTQ